MRAIAIVTAVLLASACAPRDAGVRRARIDAERRNLDTTLDQLQARLLADQARVRFWQEMRSRHESVSAIACTSQEEHADEMATHALPPARPTRVASIPEDASHPLVRPARATR